MNKKIGNIFKGDKVIWMVFFFLCMISIIEVYSASSSLTYKSGNYMKPVIRHIGFIIFGIFTMICMLKVKCKYFKIATPFMLAISLIMLIWVLIAGQATNGASRWVNFIGFQFQPSEFAKEQLFWPWPRFSVPCRQRMAPISVRSSILSLHHPFSSC